MGSLGSRSSLEVRQGDVAKSATVTSSNIGQVVAAAEAGE